MRKKRESVTKSCLKAKKCDFFKKKAMLKFIVDK